MQKGGLLSLGPRARVYSVGAYGVKAYKGRAIVFESEISDTQQFSHESYNSYYTEQDHEQSAHSDTETAQHSLRPAETRACWHRLAEPCTRGLARLRVARRGGAPLGILCACRPVLSHGSLVVFYDASYIIDIDIDTRPGRRVSVTVGQLASCRPNYGKVWRAVW